MPFSYEPELERVLAPFRDSRCQPAAGDSALGTTAARRTPADRRDAGGTK